MRLLLRSIISSGLLELASLISSVPVIMSPKTKMYATNASGKPDTNISVLGQPMKNGEVFSHRDIKGGFKTPQEISYCISWVKNPTIPAMRKPGKRP